jgi:16S rRNA processing protein RimM
LLPTERGAKPFDGVGLMAIREAKDHSGMVVARCQDIADRDAAQALKGSRIFIARSSFPTAASDEFYWVDLIGLSVVNREGLDLGVVRDLVSTGPQTVLVIEHTQGEAVREILIPFVSVYVDDVDLAQRQIRVDWQPDY